MKNLILIFSIFLNFSLFAKNVNYTADGKTMFLKQKDCMAKNEVCYAFPVGKSYSDFDLTPEYKNGEAVYSKNQINDCGEYCQTLFDSGNQIDECEDPDETMILNLDLEQIYCSKFLHYEQVLTGNKILKLNQSKKDERLLLKSQKKEKDKRREVKKKKSRNYFDSINCDDLTDDFQKNTCILLSK